MPKISIIVPIYNTPEKLLKNCIESILKQSEKQIEVFLVDDGSENNALEICYRYKDLNFIKIIHQKNSGVSVARNRGLKNATGEWVMFIDPDDELKSEDALCRLLACADSMTDIVCGSYIAHKDSGDYENHYYPTSKFFISNGEKSEIYLQLLWKLTNIGAPWGKLYRLSMLKKNDLWFAPELKRSQDIIFNLYAVFYCRKYCYIDVPVYCYNETHMNNFHKAYNYNLSEYYLKFAKARYVWMQKTNSFVDEQLTGFFINGIYRIFFQILQVGPFHKKNELSFSEACTIANNYRNKNYISLIDNTDIKIKKTSLSLKEKALHFIVKHRYWFLIYIYTHK